MSASMPTRTIGGVQYNEYNRTPTTTAITPFNVANGYWTVNVNQKWR